MHSCKKSMSYLVAGVAYIHKEPPPVVAEHTYMSFFSLRQSVF